MFLETIIWKNIARDNNLEKVFLETKNLETIFVGENVSGDDNLDGRKVSKQNYLQKLSENIFSFERESERV